MSRERMKDGFLNLSCKSKSFLMFTAILKASAFAYITSEDVYSIEEELPHSLLERKDFLASRSESCAFDARLVYI